jgi:hypothetical protein
MALDQARSTFYILLSTSAELGLHADNKKLITQNEA